LALLLAFSALYLLIADRRRVLSEQLADEAASNAALELRVNERTQSLSQANQSLRREIREREDAERELKRAQADLVQAGKLSALGKMSAGISHELNQPLMAIDSFAENAESYLARGQKSKAANNLSRISDMSQRMGRIIKNLRAFARQENEPMTDVDLAKVVDAALEIMQTRLMALGVEVDWRHPETPVFVRGGEVRLQQVVMNLASNAAEAMANQQTRRLSISIDHKNGTVLLELRDTGPGLTEADRIFDPFYTTKEVGKSEGMGLGLSISYGLVQSFGGQIRGRNQKEGGAVFTVELVAAKLGQIL
jgi:two-component system C4-dicarboxylate transport sensor histidine kinase DctB